MNFNNLKYFSHFNAERYNRKLFKEPSIQNSIRDKGFAIVDLLDENDLEKLRNGFDEIKNAVNNKFGEQFWPSGRHEDPAVRNLAKKAIDRVVPEKLKDFFVENTYSFIGETYLIKPPGDQGALDPHQDSSHADELNFFSVYVWIPLEDVQKENDAMHILPDSHKLCIKQRSLNILWVLKDKTDILTEYMVPLEMKAGQALFFDSALIHSSPCNFTEDFRLAINFYVHPKDCPFTHFFRDKNTPEGKAELYAVTPDFFYNENFEEKPDTEKYPFLGYQDIHLDHLTETEVKMLCNVLKENKWGSYKTIFCLCYRKIKRNKTSTQIALTQRIKNYWA